MILQINRGPLHFLDQGFRIHECQKVLIMGFGLYQVDDLNEAKIECEL